MEGPPRRTAGDRAVPIAARLADQRGTRASRPAAVLYLRRGLAFRRRLLLALFASCGRCISLLVLLADALPLLVQDRSLVLSQLLAACL